MKSLAIALWLSSRLDAVPCPETGEFSQAEIAAWEAAARRGKRAARVAVMLGKVRSTLMASRARNEARHWGAQAHALVLTLKPKATRP